MAVPVGNTVIVVEVCPVLQENEVPPEAVSVAELPWQIDVLPLALAVMPVVTVTVAIAVAEQVPAVTNTVYDAVDEGETVMEEALPPVLHEYVVPPDAVITALSPGQITAGVTVGLTFGFTVTDVLAISVHPPAFVTVTE